MKALAVATLLSVVACGGSDVRERTKPAPHGTVVDSNADPKIDDKRPRRRMMSPEAFLSSYIGWFGVSALDLPKQAGRGLFEAWNDYLGALGLPDYHADIPRAEQSNPMKLAAVGRLGEALCVRAAEHDLRQPTPIDARRIYAFDPKPNATLDEFTAGFDVLHRTFLSYPASLAPAGRVERFYALYQKVAAEHQGKRAPLSPEQAGWVAVCTALVQHPESGLY